ncbi:MAG: glycosyltransferase family 2 protein [Clostridium sp.]|uniref:glycosyltransferase family 2 protein n=1 Tax=Clostridium sp. TaxID=1506 RepID=UPI003F37B5B1
MGKMIEKKLSIIICTYNRAEILKECIKSIVSNNKNLEKYEIVIVDNNSSDNTRECVNEMEINNLRYTLEIKQGLSNARNRGIIEACYRYIAFIDDDVIVEKQFVENILKYFSDSKNVCGGGKIYSIWKTEKPNWFKENFYSIIGETKYGENKRKLSRNEYPYGGNMFFDKTIFEKLEVFNPDLGIQGEEVKMGEEVEVCERIRGKGHEIYYLNDVVVGHRVHMNKINKDYVKKRWEEEGSAYGKIISGNGKLAVVKQGVLRGGIILIRDIPKYVLSRLKETDCKTLYEAQLLRSRAVLKNLKL